MCKLTFVYEKWTFNVSVHEVISKKKKVLIVQFLEMKNM